MSSQTKVAFITPSYRNDYELARDLCDSIDRFVKFEHEHILLVPARDVPLFKDLEREGRRVLSSDRILKDYGLLRLPLPARIEIPFILKKRIREKYYLPGTGVISGWVAQQLIKLSAASISDADLFIFSDSDVTLIRELSLDRFFSNGIVNLQEHKTGSSLDTHKLWTRNAMALIGRANEDPSGMNYIGNLIPWSRRHLENLLKRIESASGKRWFTAIAQAKDVSEYIVYGQYLAAFGRSGVDYVAKDMKLYRSVWSPDEAVNVDTIVSSTEPENVAIHIQSTNPLSIARRRAIYGEVSARLANSNGTGEGEKQNG